MQDYKGNYKNGDIEQVQSIIIHEDKFTKVSKDEVKFPPHGKMHSYLRFTAKCGNEDGKAVIVLPVDDEKNIYLIEIFRNGTRQWSIECPRGGVDGNEDKLDAVKRELKEEIGARAREIKHLGTFWPYNTFVSNEFDLYIAKGIETIENSVIQEDEAIKRVVKVRVDEINNMIKTGEIKDAFTQVILLRAMQNNEL